SVSSVAPSAPSTPSTPTASAPAPGSAAPPTPEPSAAVSTPSAPPPAQSSTAPSDASGRRQWAYISGGVGVAGLLTSGVFALLAKSKYTDSLAHCRTKDLCSSQGITLRDQARSNGNIATVAFLIGLGGVAVGSVLLLSDTPDSAPQKAGRLQA